MEYTTSSGVRLQVGRIPRAQIDAFQYENPPPRAPVRKVTVWGDIEEEVEDERDPDYLAELARYYHDIGDKHLDLVLECVEILDEIDEAELAEYRELLGELTKGNILRFVVLDDDDLTEIVNKVFYESTVTHMGVSEAAERFGVTWQGKPVSVYAPRNSPLDAMPVFAHRQAARYCGYDWDTFCNMPGPRQSEEVAFYRLNLRIQWLTLKS